MTNVKSISEEGICSYCRERKQDLAFSIKVKDEPEQSEKKVCKDCYVTLGICDVCHESIDNLESYSQHLNEHDKDELIDFIDKSKYRNW